MFVPSVCPICQNGPLEHIFVHVKLTSYVEDNPRVSTGLAAYRCVQNGHIFFIRESDTEEMLRNSRGKSAV